MTQKLRISISRDQPGLTILHCRRITIRERLLQWLFGAKRKVTIIVPGDSVDTVSIEEQPEQGGDADESA